MKRVLVAFVLAGCLESELVECDDGRICPRGTACDVVHHTCVAPDQLVVCEGLADFAECTAVEDGRCFDGVCLPAGCGNGLEEPEENCDDGNVRSGDGCSADCTSEERCGDGFADVGRGEQCDDGNTRGHDGCTNGCTLERLVWREHLSATPTPREYALGAYTPLTREIIIFGGFVGDPITGMTLSDTWGLSESGWSFAFGFGPERRMLQGVTYDAGRQRIVMFGGFSRGAQGLLLDDTWEWTGSVWQRRITTVKPPARQGAQLVWTGMRSILFGGSQLTHRLDDTWAWDGTSWTRLLPTVSPNPREIFAAAYDPKHARIVLFGGRDPIDPQQPIIYNDTWVFDGMNWSQLATIGTPPPMAWSAFAYDAGRSVLVLSGMRESDGATEVWELDGPTWIDKTPAVTPGTYGAVVAYDAQRGRVVQYGGHHWINDEQTSEIWEWDGSSWFLRGDPFLPQPRINCAIASDPVRGRVVMFGGDNDKLESDPPNYEIFGDTWEWNGRGWKPFFVVSPPQRSIASMAFDGQGVLMFGGVGPQTVYYGDTWRWNGSTWTQVTSTGPSPRYGHAMTYDSKHKRVLLFGGLNATTAFNDTWQFDGTWTKLAPGDAPSVRAGARMAYDTVRDRVVLFGGVGLGTVALDDTWEFDGATWSKIATPIVPESRFVPSLVYDRARGRVSLFGGLIAAFSPWEWSGSAWTQPEVTQVPLISNGACATWDDARAEAILFGGQLGGVTFSTWTGGYRGDREEFCDSGLDLDGDGATGCDDDDCRFTCAPQCWDDPNCP